MHHLITITSSHFAVGRDILANSFSRILAQAYTIPLTNPIKIADTAPSVTGASKKMKPLMAIGSLLSAPTMEYVVDDVARWHQALAYEMPTAPRPE